MDVDANAECARAAPTSEPSATAVAAVYSSIPGGGVNEPATQAMRHSAAMRAESNCALKNATHRFERCHD